MLVLTRRPGEMIVLPGLNVTIQVVSIKPGAVRLGIEAPPEVSVLREELVDPAREDLAGRTGVPPQLQERRRSLRRRLDATRSALARARGQARAGVRRPVDTALESQARALQRQAEELLEQAAPPQAPRAEDKEPRWEFSRWASRGALVHAWPGTQHP